MITMISIAVIPILFIIASDPSWFRLGTGRPYRFP